ncbi:hypothetical protein [Jeotgalibaca ciconiae]|uniref:Uncharacterized protein n=1 Tax=Jeotgalibaca ciconiae TaxID=2496265 RepID=A0A3Q9BJK1_9LACT|nr:hypothetical protein [Jeotgalibaca ciconiae]AZP03343.1 hypothetical protein EJN90_00920 [Jeotgalibaca ciconiae]HJB23652.1 hypothetical protein [Candidatus Jeotgalibaca pullicola]
MAQSILSICNYETKIAPGAYFHLKTDWFESDQEIKTIIIDQDHVFSKLLSLYPKDFVMYLEQDQHGSLYRTNYPLFRREDNDYFEVDWNKKTR